MKIAVVILSLILVPTFFGQTTRLSGVIYDPGGAVVVGAEVKITNAEGKAQVAKSDAKGAYSLDLLPGLHSINISKSGFINLRIEEYFVVQSTFGKMNYDIVLFGSRRHEPCGYSGADCLNNKELLDEITVKQSPSLKRIKY